MFKILPRVHFYGEFGCLNYSILGHIEELQPSMIISTQPDYYKLMKLKCDKIVYEKDKGIYVPNFENPGSTLVPKEKCIEKLEQQGFISLHKFLKFNTEKCRDNIKPIKSPLEIDCELPKNQNYISISFRARKHEENRNLSESQWLQILKIIHSHTNLPIIAHGMEMDTKEINGVYKTKTIEESIAYMNKSKVFIASMSGIAQFASNCNCGIIQIGDPKRHIEYDPFNKGAVAVVFEDFEKALINFIK